MRRITSLILLIVLNTCFTSCENEPIESQKSQDSLVQIPERKIGNMELISEKVSQLSDLTELRLKGQKNNSLKPDCIKTAIVPDKYATIQEAIDAVCENGNVIVKSGTYNEGVINIPTPGLKIKAVGDVTLNGGFGIEDYVDNVTIENFNIDMTNSWTIVGIVGFYNSGCIIKNNNIYGTNHIAIYFRYCDNMKIVQNHVEGGDIDYGIFLDGYIDGGTAHYNTIANNTVIGINANWDVTARGSGIALRGDCDNNKVQGNQVYSCRYGFVIWWDPYNNGNCDNNIVKNNTSNDNIFSGIELGIGGMNNTFGPNNTANNNGDFGIILHQDTMNNHVFNNKASKNTTFDIINLGTDNTFKTNKAENNSGLN